MKVLVELAALGQGLYFFVGALVVMFGLIMFVGAVVKELFSTKGYQEPRIVGEPIETREEKTGALPKSEQPSLPPPRPQLPPGPKGPSQSDQNR